MDVKYNCLIIDDEPIAREILESYISRFSNLELIKSCKNAMEAFDVLNSRNIELLLLDINMPEVSGLTLAKAVSKNTKIIFTTAYREYAIDGFDLQVVDYLLKPISFERFLQGINQFFSQMSKEIDKDNLITEKGVDYIFVRSDRKMVKISFEEILYVESLGDYLKIFLHNKTIITREKISSIISKLPEFEFIRIHRSFIVSKNKIDSFTKEFVEIGERQIPISRSYKDVVQKFLFKN